MGTMTVREATRTSPDGKVVADLRPKRAGQLDDPAFRAAYDRLASRP